MDEAILDHPEAQALLADAVLDAGQAQGLAARLGPLLGRYLPLFQRQEQRRHARLVLLGKLSSLTRKTCEPIAHHFGARRENLQDFVGSSPWDDEALMAELRHHVNEQWADPRAVVVIDGSAFPKKGSHSCGVQRQWCGRLGKVENCQAGVFLAYACAKGHVGVDRRLWLPREWADDFERREKTRVPEAVAYEERWQTALRLVERCKDLPHAWVAADSEFGRASAFRAELRRVGERYAVDVLDDTSVRDLDEPVEQPARRHGSQRRPPFRCAREWAAMQPAERWSKAEARAGETGPLAYEALTTRVQTMERKRVGPEERLLVLRWQEGGSTRLRYLLSNAPAGTPLSELVRAAAERHRAEQVFGEAKGEVGLGHYEVRSWVGWHHHMSLSLLALWLLALVRSEEGGKNAGVDGERAEGGAQPRDRVGRGHAGGDNPGGERDTQKEGGGAHLPLVQTHWHLPPKARGHPR